MVRRSSLVALLFAVAALAATASGSTGARADDGHDHSESANTNDKQEGGKGGKDDQKITICHATGNGRYTAITISSNGLKGHDHHAGDIIPPNDASGSKNWDSKGRNTWESGCVAPTKPTNPQKHPIGVFGNSACSGTGTYEARFGYTSENDGAVHISVGPDNFTSPGGQNEGQPTTFQAGTVADAFIVKGIPNQVKGQWTVSYGGETHSADVVAPSGCATTGPAPAPARPPTQPVTVSLTCVTKGASTYTAEFGYSNPGSTTVSVPSGSNNGFSPAPAGRGQPIAFEPGRNAGAVTVSGIAIGTSLAWTVKTKGHTSTATATASFGVGCATVGGHAAVPSKPVIPFVRCVDAGAATYAVTYGYSNPNGIDLTIAVGPNNRLDPAPGDRGQPTTFVAGDTSSAFTVTGIPNATSVVWILSGKTATAGSSFTTPCSAPPPPPPNGLPVQPRVSCVVNGSKTYDARFGYTSENAATVAIPVGANSNLSPGAVDRGQPTLFRAGSVLSAFVVKGIPKGTLLTWTLSHGGVTHSASASTSFGTKCVGPPIAPAPVPPPPSTGAPETLPGHVVARNRKDNGVFVSCVTVHGATYDAMFGYQNDNAESVTVPVGRANTFTPTPANREQVTVFAPGNTQRAFTVLGIPVAQELTWSVTYAGRTRSANATSQFEQACGAPLVPPSAIGLFACVTPNGSTYDITFGYDNENPVGITVPIGISNGVSPGPIDRGQPVVFSPGRVTNAFTVRNVPAARRVLWRVAHAGTTLVVVTAAQPLRCGTPPSAPGGAGGTSETGSSSGVADLAVRVFPLCVVRGGTSYDAVFGYLNPSTITVRVRRGAQNAVRGAPQASSQPRAFRPGLAAIAFGVRRVPLGGTVTWTVETRGHVERAVASTQTVDCASVALGEGDLSVRKAAAPRSVAVGERIQYSIDVHEAGSWLVGRVVAIDRQHDSRLHVLSATTSRGICEIRQSDQQVTCTIGILGPGGSAHIVVAARAVAAGSTSDSVSVSGTPADTNTSNNTASAVVTVRPARRIDAAWNVRHDPRNVCRAPGRRR